MRKLLLIFLLGIGMHFCYAQQSGTPGSTDKLFSKSKQYNLYPGGYFIASGGKKSSLLSQIHKSASLNADTGAVLYVPYTGATGDVNLGAHGLTLPRIYGGVGTTDSLVIRPYQGSAQRMVVKPNGIGWGNMPVVFTSTAGLTIGNKIVDPLALYRDLFINSTLSAVSAPFTLGAVGAGYSLNIGNDNTQNWTSGPSVININSNVMSGATGSIASLVGTSTIVSNRSATATVTNITGHRVVLSSAGPVTNTTGLHLTTNANFVQGNWGIYNGLSYANYLGTGATLINTTTDNGADKLQIAGGLLANGQAHYGAGRTLGALDFMYKQKADSLYAPKSATANDSTVIHNIASTGTPEAKSFNLSGSSSIANGGDLSIYNTADQTTNYGRLRMTYNNNGFLTDLFAGRPAYYLTSENAGTNITKPDIVIGAANGYTAFRTDANTSSAQTYTYRSATDPNGPIIGNQVSVRYGFTSAATSTAGSNGFTSDVRISAINTKSWSSDPQGHPLLRGFSAVIGTLPGSSGLIPNAAAFYSSPSIAGSSITEWDGVNITFNASSASRLSYAVGARLAQVGYASNGTGLLLTNSDTDNPPSGFWGIYNNSGYNNYLGTGATLINTTTNNGTDKLQITGGLYWPTGRRTMALAVP